MKRFLLLISAFFLFACNVEDHVEFDYADALIGEWVYDHPELGIWEVMKFVPSGVFYYSNTNDNIFEFENDFVDGRYFVQDDKVIGVYELNGMTQNLDFQIQSITEWEFTARFNNLGLNITYSRLLDRVTLDADQNVDLKTMDLTKGVNIIGYASHDTSVAVVDSKTGIVTGKTTGRTYIDVITNDGIAVVEVNVNGIFAYRYDEFIGANRTEIYNVFGKDAFRDTDESIIYVYNSGEIKSTLISMDTWTDTVLAIGVSVSPDVPDSGIVNYLRSIYTEYETETTEEGEIAFINEDTFQDATVGILWVPAEHTLLMVKIDNDLFKDYSPFLGKNRQQVRTMMGGMELADSTEDKFYYDIYDDEVDYVGFAFFKDGKKYDNVQIVLTQLSSKLKPAAVLRFLSNKYFYNTERSTEIEKFYICDEENKVIMYDVQGHAVYYTIIE